MMATSLTLALRAATDTKADWDILTIAIGLGAFGSLLTIGFVMSMHGWRLERAGQPTNTQGFPAGAQWKVSDSWASNLTAITAGLGALVTVVSDKLSGVFDAGAIPVFAITAAVMLVAAALGPVAYTTMQQYRADGSDGHLEGTWRGVLVASGVTLFTVMGSLAAVGATVHHLQGVPTGGQFVVWVVLIVIAFGIFLYAVRTIQWLVQDASGAADPKRSLAGITTVDCCAGATPAARRMSLL
jgi:hypothetical protein